MKVKFVGLTEGSTANLHMRIDTIDQAAQTATLTFISPFDSSVEHGTATINLDSGTIAGDLDDVATVEVDSIALMVEPGDVVMNQNYGTQIVRSVTNDGHHYYTYPDQQGQNYSASQIVKIGHVDLGTLG